jgi:hypothetical protein
MAQWKPRKKYKKLRIGKEQSDTKDWKSSTTKEMNQQDESDAKRYKSGELLSCDNVGPVNPNSFEGYAQSFIWRDTSTNRMFSHLDKEAFEDVYLEGLEIIYKRHGIKIKVIRSDDFTTTLDPLIPIHLRDTSSHSYGEIQAPIVCSPT